MTTETTESRRSFFISSWPVVMYMLGFYKNRSTFVTIKACFAEQQVLADFSGDLQEILLHECKLNAACFNLSPWCCSKSSDVVFRVPFWVKY